MIRVTGAVLSLTASLALFSGCIAPDQRDGGSCPDLDVNWGPKAEGASRFSLDPPEPSLVLGKNTTFEVAFRNDDACTFVFDNSGSGCQSQMLRIGTVPLQLTEVELHGVPMPVLQRVCTREKSRTLVSPGDELSVTAAWDGRFVLWDHRALENGDPWVVAAYWAKPGPWPLSFGLTADATYETERSGRLAVAGDVREPRLALAPDECGQSRAEDGSGPRLENAVLTVNPAAAARGTNVTVHLEYDLTGEPGCWLARSLPLVIAQDEAGTLQRLGGYCVDGFTAPHDTGIVRLDAGTRVDLSFAWNGSDSCSTSGPRMNEGAATLALLPGGFDGEPIETTMIWLP